MITLDDIRRFATAFPEVEEFTHFRLPGFKVRGKPFAGVEKGKGWRNRAPKRVVAAYDARQALRAV